MVIDEGKPLVMVDLRAIVAYVTLVVMFASFLLLAMHMVNGAAWFGRR